MMKIFRAETDNQQQKCRSNPGETLKTELPLNIYHQCLAVRHHCWKLKQRWNARERVPLINNTKYPLFAYQR